jgi:hypothetical protein
MSEQALRGSGGSLHAVAEHPARRDLPRAGRDGRRPDATPILNSVTTTAGDPWVAPSRRRCSAHAGPTGLPHAPALP